MQVRDIMETNVKTVTPDTLVKDIALTMVMGRISGAPVVDEHKNLVGIISEKDILQHMFPNLNDFIDGIAPNFEEMEQNYNDTMNCLVKDLMTKNVASVTENIPILKAASMMWLKNFRRIPVANNEGKLLGIVSIGDVHRSIFKERMK